MDLPAQQQSETDAAEADTAQADRVALRAEARAYLFHMVETTKCFNVFRKDMQAAVNELSMYDVKLYLDVTLKCDSLQEAMSNAATQSAMLIDHEQGNPDRIRNHIRSMWEILDQVRTYRNRVAEVHMRWMICSNPKLLELEKSLNLHFSLLNHHVQGLLSSANGQDYDWDLSHILQEHRSAPQEEGWLRRERETTSSSD